jgi:hypothetical protein
MGYNLYITRRKYHFDEDGPSITEDEWRALVDADPELSFKRNDDPLTALWSGDCRYPDPWFAYSAEYGAIDTKNPDNAIVNKMLQMAAALNAKVQGDDGEVYRSPTDTYFEDDHNGKSDAGLPWWKRLLGLS